MSKLIYYVAVSMDGFIATVDHKLDWLETFTLGEDATPYEDFYRTIGAVIMGAETWRWIMQHAGDHWPYKAIPAFVISHQPLALGAEHNIKQLSGEARQMATQAKEAAQGKNVWLIGGGVTAACFAQAGELDELFVTTIPILLGQGVPLLPVTTACKMTVQSQRLLHSGAAEWVLSLNNRQ